MRTYDDNLFQKMKSSKEVETIDGVNIIMKKVPDDAREHVMDPRVLEIAKHKKKMFSSRAQQGYRLSLERYRPDKVTYDLTTTEIEVEERLIDIYGDHMIDIFLYRRKDCQGITPVLIYLHGGGFTAGDMKLFANQMKLIAELSNALIIFPEYRLAPECPFPGPIEDAQGTIDWVIQHAEELKIDVDKLMIAGDSAGAALTNSCVLKDTKKQIKRVFEIYPAVDSSDYHRQTSYTWSYDAYSIIEEQKEYAYSRIDRIKNSMENTAMDGQGNLYFQGRVAANDPLVSPVYASDEQLKQFPPTTIVASEYDFLRVASDHFVKRLTALQKDVTSIRYCGCDHGFFDLLGTVVQAEDLCHVIAETIASM